MATEIILVEGAKLTVTDEYRDVYDKLVSSSWREPCEFVLAGAEHHPVTVNPACVVYVRGI